MALKLNKEKSRKSRGKFFWLWLPLFTLIGGGKVAYDNAILKNLPKLPNESKKLEERLLEDKTALSVNTCERVQHNMEYCETLYVLSISWHVR